MALNDVEARCLDASQTTTCICLFACASFPRLHATTGRHSLSLAPSGRHHSRTLARSLATQVDRSHCRVRGGTLSLSSYKARCFAGLGMGQRRLYDSTPSGRAARCSTPWALPVWPTKSTSPEGSRASGPGTPEERREPQPVMRVGASKHTEMRQGGVCAGKGEVDEREMWM